MDRFKTVIHNQEDLLIDLMWEVKEVKVSLIIAPGLEPKHLIR